MKSYRVELSCGSETLRELPIKRDFSRGYTITTAVCIYPHTSDTHAENS